MEAAIDDADFDSMLDDCALSLGTKIAPAEQPKSAAESVNPNDTLDIEPVPIANVPQMHA